MLALLLAATLNTADLDARIQKAMHESGTTQLAVSVVRDDKVVYQRTFGATPETPFYLASAAKSLTALAAASLANDHKLDLDAPLTTTLPQLKPQPLDPARMSLRDLMTHRLGFSCDAAGWRTSYSGDWSDEKLFSVVEHYSTVTPRVFKYDNLGYVLATYAIERAAGEPWSDALRDRVLAPIGMTHTNDRPCIPTKHPHSMNRGAGGLCSTIGDLTRWLRVNMSDGVIDGKRIYPMPVMREVHAPQISLQKKFGRINRYAYGLGWYHGEVGGEWILHHFGSYPGSWTHISWMPDQHIGVVVTANAETPLPDTVAMLAYETLLGREDAAKNFDDDVKSIAASLATLPKQIDAFAQKIAASAPDSSRPAASYAGTYDDDAYGTMVVREEAGALVATMGELEAPLIHVRGDSFYVQWLPNDAPDRITFGDSSLTWHDRKLAQRK